MLIGYRSRNHPQQVDKRGPVRAVDDRATTPEVFDPLHERFGFTIDVAASAENTKCERFFSIADDGLAQPWDGERVWCNPPYSDVRSWVEKAWRETHEPTPLTPGSEWCLWCEELPYDHPAQGSSDAFTITKARLRSAGYELPSYLRDDDDAPLDYGDTEATS